MSEFSYHEHCQQLVATLINPASGAASSLNDTRALLYQEMLASRWLELFESAAPISCTLLGRPKTSALVRESIALHPPRSRFFRDVAFPIFQSARQRFAGDALLQDLLVWEDARWASLFAEDASADLDAEFSLEKSVAVHASLRLFRTQHDLPHLTSLGDKARIEEIESLRASPKKCFLSVHRRLDHRVETRWMPELEFLWLERFVAHPTKSAIESVKEVLAERGEAPTAEHVQRLSALIEELLQSGAILGSR